MKKISGYLLNSAILSLAGLLLITGPARSQRLEWDAFTPDGFADRVMLKIYSSEYIYYGLDDHTPLVFTVKGPTKVKIQTRLRYDRGMKGEQSYGLIVLEDGVEQTRTTHRTTPSAKASYVDKQDLRLGKAMKYDFAVSDTGRHTFQVRLPDHSGKRVEARTYHVDDDVELTPVEYERPVTVFLSESRERTCYLITRGKEVQVRLEGPTRLEVQTRLDFTPEMVGKQMYSVTVTEDGKELKTFHIESVRSSTVTYKDRPEFIPGALNTVYVEVPEGIHTYTFRLPQTPFPGVVIRFLMPSKDVW